MKSNITNAKYQSTFLPILSRAETDIKELIINSALLLRSKAFLRLQIKQIISNVMEKLPKNIIDRQSYIDGLWYSSERMIKKYYDRMIIWFFFVAMLLKKNKIIKKTPKTQLELIKIVSKVKSKDLKEKSVEMADLYEKGKQYKIDMIFEQKGSPNVENYINKIKEYIGDVAKTEFAPAEEGKKKITMWQKAELDIRHESQIKMVEDLIAQGVIYAWTSSHPDCSKRCEKWQGKLFDLVNDADNGKFKMKKRIEGHTVYSLKAVTSVIDKYGYKNNIIVGFNCRHKLVPFTPKSEPPTEYDAEDVKKNREINAKLRAYEREIRRLKRLSIFYKTTDKKLSKMYLDRAKALTEEYKAFAEEHGFAWLPYRLEV
jgi:hypothetical protein